MTKTTCFVILLCTALSFSASKKEDYSNRNPDPDDDGVCDSWVSKNGFSSEFAVVCTGVDKCPNEPGDGEDGCPKPNEEPVQEKKPNRDPDPDRDGVCSPWVWDEGLGSEYAHLCKAYDNCPDKAGSLVNKGCP